MVHTSKSLEETAAVAKIFLNSLTAENKAVAVAFYGDLGAGKTTFIQALAKEMGIQEPITSPTFVIQKSYSATRLTFSSKNFGGQAYFDTLVHIDAYRLNEGEELLKLRFGETLEIPNSLICVEWPDNVKSALPPDSKKVICRFIDETTHEYEF